MVVTDPGSTDKEISVDDMKLLVTAVISFNSQQIVSAFLNVKRLKIAIIDEISKTVAFATEVAQDADDSEVNTADLSMSDQLQTVFLRPDTPGRVNTPPSLHNTNTFNSRYKSSEARFPADDLSVVTVKSLPSKSNPVMSGATTSTSNTSRYPNLNLNSSSKSQQNKKYGKLDELLRNHVGFTSFTKETNISRHVLCSKQVTNVVSNSAGSISSSLSSVHPAATEQQKHRKRKSTAPRYIPWLSTSPRKQMAEPHEISSIRNTSASRASASDPYISSPQIYTMATDDSGIVNLGQSSNTNIQRNEPFKEMELFQRITSNSNHMATSADDVMTSQDMLVSQTSPSIIDVSGSGLKSMQSRNRSQPLLYGPFVTNSQAEFGYDSNEFASEFTENINDSIDFSSLMVGDPSLTYNLNDLSMFSDLPNPSAMMDGINSTVMPARPRSRKKRSARHINGKAVLANVDQPGSHSGAAGGVGGVVLSRLRCRRCNERFTSKTDYQLHLKSQVCSTGYAQTHTCQICGYCALTRQRLIVHMRTHSGERPHRCPFCSYAATQQAPLKRHIQNIHMKQGAVSLTSTGHGDQPPPKQVDQLSVNPGGPVSRRRGSNTNKPSLNKGGQAIPGGPSPAFVRGLPHTISEGHPPITLERCPPVTSESHPPITSEGHPPMLSEGYSPLTTASHPLTSEGRPLTNPEGHSSTTSTSQPPVTSEGQSSVFSEGRSLTSEGQSTSTYVGQPPATSKDQSPMVTGDEPTMISGVQLLPSLST